MKTILVSILLFASLKASAGTPVKKTVKEFLAMNKADTTLCELSGVVSRVRNHERSRLFITDETGTVLIYGLADSHGLGVIPLDIRKGDTLTVRGRLFFYDNRVVEMKNALYVSHAFGPDHDNVKLVDELDKYPTFRGHSDLKAFSKWVSAQLKYPKEALDAHMDGNVIVQFVVGKNGAVQEVQVIKGVHPALNAEAVRVVRSSPKWKPGMVDGKPVRYTYRISVGFGGEF